MDNELRKEKGREKGETEKRNEEIRLVKMRTGKKKRQLGEIVGKSRMGIIQLTNNRKMEIDKALLSWKTRKKKKKPKSRLP